jgi:hypothetical protein
MTLWKTDALFGNSLIGLFRWSNRELDKTGFNGPSGAHKQPWTFVLYQSEVKNKYASLPKKKSSKVMNPYVERLAGRLETIKNRLAQTFFKLPLL